MKPERWREVEKIFYSALERSSEERNAFIAEACAGDLELQKEVESLLACNEEAENISILNLPEDSLETKTLLKKPDTLPDPNDNQDTPPPFEKITEPVNVAKAPGSRLYRMLAFILIAAITAVIALGALLLGTGQSTVNHTEEREESDKETTLQTVQANYYGGERGISFEHITIDQGLSQNSIYAVLQDHQGFLWFGTQDGLNRYDGYDFTIFRRDPKDANSLSNNFVTSIFEDRDGMLWIGTAAGLNRLDPTSRTFTRYRHDDNNPNSLISDKISCVYGDEDGSIWIGTSGGLSMLDYKNGIFTNYQHDDKDRYSISSNYISRIFQDRNGRLWIGTSDQALNRFDYKTRTFSSYRIGENFVPGANGKHITSIFCDREGVLWVGTFVAGLYKFDPRTGSASRYFLDHNNSVDHNSNRIYSIAQNNDGSLWVGTGGGLYIFDLENRTFVNYMHDVTDQNSISDNRITNVCKDRSGILWIGTEDGGVNKYDPKSRKFAVLRPASSKKDLSNNIIAIHQDQKRRLWVGTANSGLYRYESDGNTITVYRHDDKDPNSLSSDTIRSIYEDHDGRLWIGTLTGLDIYDPKEEKFVNRKSYLDLYSKLKGLAIMSIYEDRSQNIWFGTLSVGLIKYDSSHRTFSDYKKKTDSTNSISNNRISSIYEDRSGMIWIGTLGSGINRFDPKSQKFTVYKNDPENTASISNDRISSICEDPSGTLWIGTQDGLDRFNPDSNNFTSFTKDDGLASSNIYGILVSNDGYLWLSTNNGLSKLDPKAKSFKNFDLSEGLQAKEYSWGSFYKSPGGEMFFGGSNGFNRFYPEQIKDNSYVPPVCITLFKTFDKKGKPVFIRDSHEDRQEPIVFSYDCNFFQFEFAALSYTHQEKNRYAYKLEGLDNGWINCGSRHFARYDNLGPGEYTFKVIGSNNDGVWNREGTMVRFVITPPFWKTWWAYLFYILFLTTLIYSLHRYRLLLLEERNRVLEIKVNEKNAEVNKKNEELEKQNEELVKKNNELIESHKRADRIFSALAEALPGTILDGKYRLDEKIGSGGFGVVYRATHLAIKRTVAVKVFKPVPGNDSAEALERFKLEAVSACRVNHTNAVAVLDFGISTEGIAYLVMELLNGHTLTKELRKNRTLSAERCVQILLPVCKALSKAHSRGIIHRDIKPDNIFLHQAAEGEVVKVVDFGIAKLVENRADESMANLTATGGIIGTPLYLAPERLAMNDYDGRADVYSLGIMLYEMLCGRVPFLPEEGGYPGVMMAHMSRKPRSIRELNPKVSVKLEQIVMRMLEKDPSKRPTAIELAEEFAAKEEFLPQSTQRA